MLSESRQNQNHARMWPKSYSDIMGLNVSRESCGKLEVYYQLLLKWQRAINLISGNTLQDAWVRHFADSAQLCPYIPQETRTLVDWGSGAGFPALVIAILKPELDVHIVESDERKCQFMRTVSRETSTPIRIHTARIEDLSVSDIKPDLITARALASVQKLLGYAHPWVSQNPALSLLLLKGESAQEELDLARKSYDFEAEAHPSVTDPRGCVVRLSCIRKL